LDNSDHIPKYGTARVPRMPKAHPAAIKSFPASSTSRVDAILRTWIRRMHTLNAISITRKTVLRMFSAVSQFTLLVAHNVHTEYLQHRPRELQCSRLLSIFRCRLSCRRAFDPRLQSLWARRALKQQDSAVKTIQSQLILSFTIAILVPAIITGYVGMRIISDQIFTRRRQRQYPTSTPHGRSTRNKVAQINSVARLTAVRSLVREAVKKSDRTFLSRTSPRHSSGNSSTSSRLSTIAAQ